MTLKTANNAQKTERFKVTSQKLRSRHYVVIGLSLLLSGISILMPAIIYESSILFFIGLTITLWSTLLLFMRPTHYIRSTLLDSTLLSSLETLDQLITCLGYKGKAVYLPPKSLKEMKGGQVFIPTTDTTTVPPVNGEHKASEKTKNGIYLTPPGLGLANLFEEEINKNFVEFSLDSLVEFLPKIFVENLELAKNLKISYDNNLINVKLIGISFNRLYEHLYDNSNIFQMMGCPFSSAIICALTRIVCKPIIINKFGFSSKEQTINFQCKILEE